MSAIRSAKEAHVFAVRLMQHLVVPTFVLDPERRVIIWNKACERLTGVPAGEVLGTSDHWRAFYDAPRPCLADLLIQGLTDQIDALYPAHSEPADSTQGLRAENWCVMPQARKRLYLMIDAGPIYAEDGTLLAVVETLRDCTEQKLAQMALQTLAVRDGLTGLANRRSFDDKLDSEWRRAQADGGSLALLLADVDHFKAYNDTYGHCRGDECLKTVARALEAQVFRPTDLAARYGGEEFAVVMPLTGLDGALYVAERIRQAVVELDLPPAPVSGAERVTLSIGVAAIVPGPDAAPVDLVHAADSALYRAKRGGRNRVVGGDSVLSLVARDDLGLILPAPLE
jgi:diguanylate cyclase (GGDEF)-like protein